MHHFCDAWCVTLVILTCFHKSFPESTRVQTYAVISAKASQSFSYICIQIRTNFLVKIAQMLKIKCTNIVRILIQNLWIKSGIQTNTTSFLQFFFVLLSNFW